MLKPLFNTKDKICRVVPSFAATSKALSVGERNSFSSSNNLINSLDNLEICFDDCSMLIPTLTSFGKFDASGVLWILIGWIAGGK